MPSTVENRLLPLTLEASVSLRMLQLAQSPVHPATLLDEKLPCTWCKEETTCSMCKGTGQMTRGANAARLLCERADIMLFGGGKVGQAAEVFNALAEAISYMAFLPGGIKTFGMHFEGRWPKGQDLEVPVTQVEESSSSVQTILDFLVSRDPRD